VCSLTQPYLRFVIVRPLMFVEVKKSQYMFMLQCFSLMRVSTTSVLGCYMSWHTIVILARVALGS